jgi:hypothetical protein
MDSSSKGKGKQRSLKSEPLLPANQQWLAVDEKRHFLVKAFHQQ